MARPVVYWVAHFTELETELAYARLQGALNFDLRFIDVNNGDSYFQTNIVKHGVEMEDKDITSRLEAINQDVDKIVCENPDLVIFRYPYYLSEESKKRISDQLKCIAWWSEQGPMREQAISSAKGFSHVAVNNMVDKEYCEERGCFENTHCLPWGCFPGLHKRGEVVDDYKCDIISDGNPHYNDGDGQILTTGKKTSCDVIVLPIMTLELEYSYRVYGKWEGAYGWSQIPNINMDKEYRGFYSPLDISKVYSSAKIYAGITWNHAFGGYGSKLARAMGCGIPVLWHRTVGMEKDGLEEGTHLEATASPGETVEKVKWLMKEEKKRKRLGEMGQKFAYENWDWNKNILKFVKVLS